MNLQNMKRSEDTEQIAVITWARLNTGKYPDLKWLHHIPNGGKRNRNQAVKFKAMGVVAGVSDLCLPIPKGKYCGLYIEMKYEGGKLRDTQKDFLEAMEKAGHFVATCYSSETAIEILRSYVNLTDDAAGIFENNAIWK